MAEGKSFMQNLILTVAGVEASRRQAQAIVSASGQQTTQEGAKEGFFDWLKSTFPSLTRDEDTWFSTLLEIKFTPEEREIITNLVYKELKGGTKVDGKTVYFDHEQFVMDLFNDSNDWKRIQTSHSQQDVPRRVVFSGNKDHKLGIARVLVKRFMPEQAKEIKRFFDRLVSEGYDVDGLQADFWSIYQEIQDEKKGPDDSQNPMVIFLGAIADRKGNYNDQKAYAENTGLLRLKETAVNSSSGDPSEKLLRELVLLRTDEERVKHLRKSNRILEMRIGRRAIKGIIKDPVSAVIIAASGVTIFVVGLPIILSLLF